MEDAAGHLQLKMKGRKKGRDIPRPNPRILRKKNMREKKRVTLSTVINLFSLHNIRNTQPPLAMSVKGCMLFCNLSGLQKALSRWCTLQFVYVANLNHFVNGASYLYSSFCDAAGMEACSVCSYHVTTTQKPLLMLFIAVGDGKTLFNLQ